MHLVHQKCTKPARSSSKGKGISLKGSTKNYSQVLQFGYSIGKVYKHTRTTLKIRSTPTDGEQKAQMREWSKETRNVKSYIPAIPHRNRDGVIENSQRYASSNSVQPPLPTLDLLESDFSENREESQIADPL